MRELIDKIEKLVVVNIDKHRPPTFAGGKEIQGIESPTFRFTFGGLAYEGVLESAQTKFTLFLDDGTPLRAVMNTVWKKFSPAHPAQESVGKPNRGTKDKD